MIDPTCLESAAAPGRPPRLLAICSAQPEPLWPANDSIARNAVLSAIRKRAISTLADPVTVQVGPLGVAGDAQADRAVHGGRNQAVYAYPFEHYAFWSTVRVRVCLLSPPQFLEHADQADHSLTMQAPGHGCMLQACWRVMSSGHGAPLNCG